MSSTETANTDKFWSKATLIAGWNQLKMIASTAVVLIFILNGVALGLYGFGLVKPSAHTAAVMGAFSVAFAAVILFQYIHRGVIQQATTKKRR